MQPHRIEFVVDVPAALAPVLHEAAEHELEVVWGPDEAEDPGLTWTEDDRRSRVEMIADWTRLKVELDAGAKHVPVSRALAERVLYMHDEDDAGFPTYDLLEHVSEAHTSVSVGRRRQALAELSAWWEFVDSIRAELETARTEATP